MTERPDPVPPNLEGPTKETLALCKRALASLELRKDEDIDAWAEKLARAVVPEPAPHERLEGGVKETPENLHSDEAVKAGLHTPPTRRQEER